MRIVSIKMHNVFRFGETDNEINLDDVFSTSDDDIALITGSIDGDENDSNGAGKSTIGEALFWALYKTIPRLTRNSSRKGTASAEVIRTDDSNEIADGIRDAYVEVRFKTRDGRNWRLKRGMNVTKTKNHSKLLELYCEEKPVPDDVDEAINKMIGTSSESILNSIFFAQMDTGKFLSGTDKDRRDILMDLRGLVVIDRMLKIVREVYKKDCSKAHEDLNIRYEMIRERLEGENDAALRKEKLDAAAGMEQADKTVESKKSGLKELEEDGSLTKFDEIGKRKALLDAAVESLKREKSMALDGIRSRMDDISSQIKGKEEELGVSMTKEKNSLEKEFKEANSVLEMHTRESIEGRRLKVNDAKEEMTRVQDEIEQWEEKLRMAIESRSSFSSKVSSLNEDLQSMSSIAGTGKCPTCSNEWSKEEAEKKISEIKSKIDAAESGRSSSEIQENESRVKIKELKMALGVHKKVVEDESVLAADIEKIRGANETVKSCRKRAETIKAKEASLSASIEKLKVDLSSVKKDMEDKEGEFTDRERSTTELVSQCSKELEEARVAKEGVEGKINSIRKEIEDIIESKSGLSAKIARIDEKLDSRKKDSEAIAELKKKIKSEKTMMNRIEYLESKLAGDIKNDVAESCIPLLNFYTNEFLSILRDGMRVEVASDGKNISIRLIGSTASSYNMLSGGEQSALRLAMSMALSMLSIGGASDIPDMIFLDEIFGALDTKTRDNVFRLLKRLNRNFERIIVITHDSLIKERFRTRIHIDKKDGISHIAY